MQMDGPQEEWQVCECPEREKKESIPFFCVTEYINILTLQL